MHARIGMGILFLGILFLAGNASAAFVCDETLTPKLVYISAQTNAHADTTGAYPIGIGCGDTTAGVSVQTDPLGITILQLSTVTNAHAEIPGGSNYTQLIKVKLDIGTGTLTVNTDTSPTCANLNGGAFVYVPFVHLNSATNAHVQSPDYAGPFYGTTVCLGYDASGTPAPASNIIQVSLSGNSLSIPQGGTTSIQTTTTNLVSGNLSYTQISSLHAIAICNSALPACQAIDDYQDFSNALATFVAATSSTYSGPLVKESVQLSVYNNNLPDNPYVSLYNQFQSNWPSNPETGPYGTINSFTTHSISYPINAGTTGTNPLNLPLGAYRILSADVQARFIFNGAPNNNEITTNDNFAIATLSVTGCGDGTYTPPAEKCGEPGAPICPVGQSCNTSTCQCEAGSGSSGGTGGDVYVVKDIQYPQLYRGNTISAEITVENKKFISDPTTKNNVMFNYVVRDSEGKEVAGLSPSTQTNNFTSATQTFTFDLEIAGNDVFNLGETYTLFVKVQPYVGSSPDESESITGNNSAFRTFTVLAPLQNVSVPDAPAWMSILMVSIVLGWLFFSTRKKF